MPEDRGRVGPAIALELYVEPFVHHVAHDRAGGAIGHAGGQNECQS